MMSTKPNDNKDQNRQIPDSSSKQARGSKNVHSKTDDSQKEGWKPDAKSEEE